jgi:pentatricopeptide repeat protein
MFKKLKEEDYPLDATSYNIILQSHLKKHKSTEFWDTHAEMKARNVKPNVQTYNILIDAYGTSEKVCLSHLFFVISFVYLFHRWRRPLRPSR